MKIFTFTGEKGTRTHLRGALGRKKMPAISNSSFGILCIVLLMIVPFQITAQNIRGLAPVQTPLGGYAVDGNAYVNLPVAGDIFGGDLFFERISPTPLATANPGGLFVPSYFSNPPVSLGTGEFTFESNPEVLLYPNTFLFRDDITNNDPTIFTSSNKINDDPTTYTWGAGSSPNKNEIQSAIAHFTYGEETLGGDPDDLWMIFAADREVTNGSSYIDFEILQNILTREGTTSGSFSSAGPNGGRTLGDLLVTIEFTQGGGEATAVVRRWEASGTSYAYNVYSAFPVGTIFISNNTVATIVPYTVYNQSPLVSGPFSGYYEYSINQWAEGAVNISELFAQGEDPCLQISTLFIRTRTSGNSGQSELKDFPGKPIQLNLDLTPDSPEVGSVENCGPWEGTLDATECEGIVKWYDMQSSGELLYTGASYDPGEISETTSFWVSCTVNDCEGPRAEVIITIIDNPSLDPINNVAACDSYDLPAVGTISGTNLVSPKYYDDSQANGGSEITDLTLTSNQTVWVYDETGTTPNCSDEISFTVTINDTPDLDPITNVTACDSYDLPAVGTISGTNLVSPKYYDDSQANGGSEITDLTLTSNQTVWVYDETGTTPNCSDEISFTVTINDSPSLDPITNVTACDSYDLPAVGTISGTNLVSPKYYDDSQANGGSEITDLTLTSNQTVWVYDETGTTPNCSEEISFMVYINETPQISTTNPPSLCVGESVQLANYVSNPDSGSLSYHSSQADADSGMNVLASTIVTPGLGATDYFVRSENTTDGDCYSTAKITVTVITCITGQGCTLGYWKNHTDRWCEAYDTCTLYGAVFGSAPNPSSPKKLNIYNLTLLEVLNLGGNSYGENLARQSVAALLNTCSSEVGFEYSSVTALINAVNAAWESNPNTAKNFATYLDGLNNSFCPLGGSSATTAPSPECIIGAAQDSILKVAGDINETSIVVNSFSAYPVPFRESLSIQYDFDYASAAVIQIYDMQGRLLSTQQEANASKGKVTNLSINFKTLPSQIYIIKVTTDRDIFTKKIISDK